MKKILSTKNKHLIKLSYNLIKIKMFQKKLILIKKMKSILISKAIEIYNFNI